MVLLTDIKGNKQKTDIKVQKQIENYRNLPGVYVTVTEMLGNTKEAGLTSWNKQKEQSVHSSD